MKVFIAAAIALLALAGWGAYLSRTYTPPPLVVSDAADVVAQVPVATTPPAEMSPAPIPTETPSPTPAPTAAQPPAPTDTASPSVPGKPAVSPVSTAQVNLAWSASADAVGVAGYRVYRNGQSVGTTVEPYFADIDMPVVSTYTYTVLAYDAAGNESARSRQTSIARATLAARPVATALPTTAPTSAPSSPQPTATPAPTPTVSSGTPPTQTPIPTPTRAALPTPTRVPQATPAPTPIPTATPKPAPTATPTPVPAGCGSGGACTAANVAAHNTRANCWVYLSPLNKTYNITGYVANGNTHPGGDVIVPYCGTNIYNYFIGTAGGHKHSTSALNSVLQAYYIGPFQP